ncbi:hypothetical protein EDC04DRAFT_2603124 [Pisolithus marmoratus]|nr:hypothetical protein EDC04DRAFT_2603124 [Pisolithus marmoratus]
MFQATHSVLKDSETPIPNVQPRVHMPSHHWNGVYGLPQVDVVPRPHGQEEREKEKFTISENPEKFGLEAMIELSECQKVVKEAGKYMVLPYLIPTPDVGGMVKRFMEVLQKKQVFLAELADIEATCEGYETALH